ncbi:MAG: DUF1624 domain-containing protein [Chlorobi bacterium]|nr:DUF1624 domain-containing protein [Chlorobiota bacterium]
MTQSAQRIIWIDLLRGLAILLMIPANITPHLELPHPLYERILASLAAPLFLAVSGYMVLVTAHRHNLQYYLKRGGIVLLMGVLVDVGIWRIYPFFTADVLYTIGIALPFLYLLRKSSLSTLAIMLLILFAASPLLVSAYGYQAYPVEPKLADGFPASIIPAFRQWFIDGWFPLTPWLGFAVLGGILRRLHAPEDPAWQRQGTIIVAATTLIVIGIGLMIHPLLPSSVPWTDIFNREGYSELIYPPVPGYLVAASGAVFILFIAFSKLTAHGFRPLQWLGKHALFVYIFHQILTEYLLDPVAHLAGAGEKLTEPQYWLATAIIILICVASAYYLERLQRRYQPRVLFVKVFLGS